MISLSGDADYFWQAPVTFTPHAALTWGEILCAGQGLLKVDRGSQGASTLAVDMGSGFMLRFRFGLKNQHCNPCALGRAC